MTISPLPPSSHPDYNQTDIEGPMLSSLLAHLHPAASSGVQPGESGVTPMSFLWEGFKIIMPAKEGLVGFGTRDRTGRRGPRTLASPPYLTALTAS